MTYHPTNIASFNFDSEKKEMRPALVSANLKLIARETQVLADLIMKNKALAIETKKRFDQDEVSFRHNFLAQW